MQYGKLGREEDPPFTIKTMVVKTLWPGATTLETVQQVTDRIEKKLEELPNLDYLKSYTKPGESVVFVTLKDAHACLGGSRPLVSGAQEGRRHQADLAAGRARSVLQRRVRRHLFSHLRPDLGRLLAPRVARPCRTSAWRAAQRAGRCQDRSDRHSGREDLPGVLHPAARRHGPRHFQADRDAAGAERYPAQRHRRCRC